MYTNQRNISRVLAAAVASTGFAIAPMPTFAASLTCTSATFTATADNAGNIVVSCTAPGNTAACSLTASPSSVPASGGNVQLTASNCGTVTSVAKNGTQIATSGTSWTQNIPANSGTSSVSFTYTVQGGNGSDSVVVTQSGSGGGGGGDTSNPPPASCEGYTVVPVSLPWSAQSKVTTKGFNNSTMVVASFTTPATSIVSGGATLAAVEFGDGKATRTAALSTSPCDLSGSGVGKGAVFPGNTQTPGLTYQINGSVSFLNTRVVLKPSTTYYFNIVNRDSRNAPSCGTSSCNMIIQLTVPTGL
jgi:hypothetical protein